MPRISMVARMQALVTAAYLQSRDFNGILFDDAAERLKLSPSDAIRATRTLIRRQGIAANFGDRHPNAYIRALPDENIEKQLVKFNSALRAKSCLYPTDRTLARVVPSDLYADRPFTRRLALGEPQLAYAAFDLAVLDFYRNDPRYLFEGSDAGGRICVLDDYYESSAMPDRDQVLLASFGFCYAPDMRRAVAVFLRYLSGLSPEHQQFWHTRMLVGDYTMHPDYWASSVGDFPTGASVFHFVLAEMRYINELARAIRATPLFKETFEDDRPQEFTFLLRPTRKEFDAFVQTLDKMLSDNINPTFFRRTIDPYRFEERNGVPERIKKGTIAMLEEWIGKHFRSPDPRVPKLFETLRYVRTLRSKPSHSLRANLHDESFFEEQRTLIVDVYDAVNTLRLVLEHWPETASCQMPRILRGDTRMWTH